MIIIAGVYCNDVRDANNFMVDATEIAYFKVTEKSNSGDQGTEDNSELAA